MWFNIATGLVCSAAIHVYKADVLPFCSTPSCKFIIDFALSASYILAPRHTCILKIVVPVVNQPG